MNIIRKYNDWIDRTPLKMKFVPTQIIIILVSVLMSYISVTSINTVNMMSKKVFTENVSNTKDLNTIFKTMYKCRVIGRDILLEENEEKYEQMFEEYVETFHTLDRKMDAFVLLLKDERQEIFSRIIEEKNQYRDSMILSAELQIEGASRQEALHALTIVTPIANEFFGSIEQFIAEEEIITTTILAENDKMVKELFLKLLCTNALIALLIFFLVYILVDKMSKNLIKLEKNVNEIANTMNMNAKIPEELFNKDEIGSIAIAVDKMKDMLFKLSFTDGLVDGYNVSAYKKELEFFFENCNENGRMECACVIADLNNLKYINDTFGHFEGDDALRSLYAILDDSCHQYGKSFRTGGDEFIALLTGCTKDQLEECMAQMEYAMHIKNHETEYEFSFAFGYEMFTCSSKEEFESFIKIVDRNMYKKKEAMKDSMDTPPQQ